MTGLLCYLHFIWLNFNETKLLLLKWFFRELKCQRKVLFVANSELAAKISLKFADYESILELNSSVK